MNEEIRCITNEGKAAKNEWENHDSDFFLSLYSVYKKFGQFFFHTLLANLFKQMCISSVTSYNYLNTLIVKNKVFLKYYVYAHNPFNKVIKFIHIAHHRTPDSIYACILPHAC